MTPNDQRDELVLILESGRDVQSFLQSVPHIIHGVDEAVGELILLSLLGILTLLEFRLQLQKRFLHACKSLVDLHNLPLQVCPITVLAVQVEGHALPEALQNARGVFYLLFNDDKILANDRVLVFLQRTRSAVEPFKEHLTFLRVYGLLVIAVRDEEVVKSPVGHFREQRSLVDRSAERQ